MKPLDFTATGDEFVSGEPLSAETRRLIDEAIRAGRVQHVPRGTSAFAITPVKDDRAYRADWHEREKRHRRVIEMLRAGATTEAIFRETGVHRATVARIARAAGIVRQRGRRARA